MVALSLRLLLMGSVALAGGGMSMLLLDVPQVQEPTEPTAAVVTSALVSSGAFQKMKAGRKDGISTAQTNQ